MSGAADLIVVFEPERLTASARKVYHFRSLSCTLPRFGSGFLLPASFYLFARWSYIVLHGEVVCEDYGQLGGVGLCPRFSTEKGRNEADNSSVQGDFMQLS